MKNKHSRREFLKLSGLAGVVFSSGLFGGRSKISHAADEEFYFVQLTDSHYGFNKKKINPDPVAGLNRAIDIINSLEEKPDFIMFTGDLTHTVADARIRQHRMEEFKKLVERIEVKDLKFIPGEHDASLDSGKVYQQIFGDMHYFFQHKGVNFIALDNVSNPRGILGDSQLEWLASTLNSLDKNRPLVVFAHRPLFNLYPKWGWSTGDASKAMAELEKFRHVNVFYGHIHQDHHHHSGHIAHHSARSLIFPLPKPGSTDKRKPVPWDRSKPFNGLGIRNIESYAEKVEIDEIDIT
ncbi:MAG: metallophosphoesterase [Thioalkalispiraceae bacterium]